LARPPVSTLFPYTTLFRSLVDRLRQSAPEEEFRPGRAGGDVGPEPSETDDGAAPADGRLAEDEVESGDVEVSVHHAEGPGVPAAPMDEGVENGIASKLPSPVVVPLAPKRRGRSGLDRHVEALFEPCADRGQDPGVDPADRDEPDAVRAIPGDGTGRAGA